MPRYLKFLTAFVLLFGFVSTLPADEGLLVHYDFSDGGGTVVTDRSGNGADGKIVGKPEWITVEGLPALRLNGVDAYIDCGKDSPFGANYQGTFEMWCKLEAHKGGFFSRSTGGRWTDERLVFCYNTYGNDHNLLFTCSDGGTYTSVQVTDLADIGRWTHLVVAFDSEFGAVYMNGRRVGRFARSIEPAVKDVPLRIGYCEGLGHSFLPAVLDEVRIYDRRITEDEVIGRYRAGAKSKGTDVSWLDKVDISVSPFPNRGQVLVEIDSIGLSPLPKSGSVDISVLPVGHGKGLMEKTPLEPGISSIYLDMSRYAHGEYTVTTQALDASGKKLGKSASKEFKWTKPSVELASEARVLNNFVIELLDRRPAAVRYQEYTFVTPYEGWVFFSSAAQVDKGERFLISVDAAPETQRIIIHDGQSGALEAMRYLSKGKHTVKMRWEGAPKPGRLTVRTIPELIYCQLGSNPHVSNYGAYDWNFIQKHLAKDINCMVSSTGILTTNRSAIEEWKRMGKRIIFHAGVPGLGLPAWDTILDDTYRAWHDNVGFQDPLADGIIVDEFGGGSNDPNYLVWANAVERTYQDSSLKGKVFYPFTGSLMYDCPPTKFFSETVMRHGGRLVEKHYFPELPTASAALDSFSIMRRDVAGWDSIRPGTARNIIFALGYMSQPNESLNIDPTVDFKVFLDMEMHLIANDPAFFGFYGILHYLSGYTDEETVRWAAGLYRHYCIEGKTNLLSKELGYKYKLDHVLNPDFDDGLAGWQVSEAEQGSVTTGEISGWSWLQGRYPPTGKGSKFLLAKRSAKGPNVFSQEIKNLQPGKLYSMKMFSGDRQDLLNGVSNKHEHAVTIRLENVELVPERCFTQLIDNCYSHHWDKFTDKHKYWMNYHWRVFRANGSTAKLTVSDWAGEGDPGGPAGQELMFNFVEIQPYFND